MKFQIEMNGELREIELTQGQDDGQYRAIIDGEPAVDITAQILRPGVLSLHIGGEAYRCVLEESAERSAIYLGGKRLLYRVDDVALTQVAPQPAWRSRGAEIRNCTHAGTGGARAGRHRGRS